MRVVGSGNFVPVFQSIFAEGMGNPGRQHRLGRLGSQRINGRLDETIKVQAIYGRDNALLRAELSCTHSQRIGKRLAHRFGAPRKTPTDSLTSASLVALDWANPTARPYRSMVAPSHRQPQPLPPFTSDVAGANYETKPQVD